jgi:hypothetical protein
MLPFEKWLNYRKDSEDYYYVLYLLQVYSNAFAYIPEYGKYDCEFSNLEMSKYIYGCCDVET